MTSIKHKWSRRAIIARFIDPALPLGKFSITYTGLTIAEAKQKMLAIRSQLHIEDYTLDRWMMNTIHVHFIAPVPLLEDLRHRSDKDSPLTVLSKQIDEESEQRDSLKICANLEEGDFKIRYQAHCLENTSCGDISEPTEDWQALCTMAWTEYSNDWRSFLNDNPEFNPLGEIKNEVSD